MAGLVASKSGLPDLEHRTAKTGHGKLPWPFFIAVFKLSMPRA
jgi:hypothetical protein